MVFVTTLRLESGDRDALDGVVDQIRTTAERKGAELKGPHTPPPEDCSVPLYKRADGSDTFDSWRYTVYRREVKLVGHDDLAASITNWDYPDSVHLEVEVSPVTGAGR